ncbi:MAG: branched-chain amino acid transaminase [Polyangiaceae bacterium]
MHDRDGFIWYDGELVPWRSATTHVLTHSLHYGLALFEGVRAYRTATRGSCIFRLREHTARLFGSARAYRVELPYDEQQLLDAQRAVVRANGLDECYLRPLVFLGSEKLGVSPRGTRVHVAIAAWPWQRYIEGSGSGLRVKTSSFVRPHVNALLSRAKISANYVNSMLACQEAQDEGYDEALVLDGEGYVAEGPGENLFIVKGGRLFEPAPNSALPGITRDSIATLARELGYTVSERRLTRDDVYLADEAFFCGTAVEVEPVIELDRRQIGSGRPGPVTEAVVRAYADAVRGRNAKHASWLTEV